MSRRTNAPATALVEIELVSSSDGGGLARDLDAASTPGAVGDENSSLPTGPTSEAVRGRVRRAGLDPSDTLVALLSRRIRRHSTIEEFRANGWVFRAPDGTLRRIDDPRMDPADRIMAEMLVEEENDDRLRTAWETRRIAPEPPPASEPAPRDRPRAR